ncbi:toprim domain-containing protein [Methylobacterium sp. J-088]|uniref:DUF7146 domain-containing protein n=1 Tax=Methylobacterium sp. J-088 TaxID=2836664 RepID=UPI001FBA4FE1|nr:toprim domain-containing protein [Methylobacterium sp. J-088]MCJ2065897.1 toprim domain-containing protein [Methylobacterium sp. J-088]
MNPRSIAQALPNGRVISGGVSFAAPGHSKRDDSGRVLPSRNMPFDIFVHSLAGDDDLALRDFVLEQLERAGLIRRDRGSLRGSTALTRPQRDVSQARTPDPGETERTTRGLEIYREADTLWSSPVEAYLVRERGLQLFEGLGRAIRYHPSCPFGPHRTPAMVALVRDIRTNEPRAIHRTALTLDGRKAEIGGYDRLTLGPVSGAAIKLTPDEEVTLCLGIGEGIESALSLRRLSEFGASPVWSLISANGVERLPVLTGIESLWLAVDHDPAGMSASEACAGRWRNAGAEAFLVKPLLERSDLNDVFRERLHA